MNFTHGAGQVVFRRPENEPKVPKGMKCFSYYFLSSLTEQNNSIIKKKIKLN